MPIIDSIRGVFTESATTVQAQSCGSVTVNQSSGGTSSGSSNGFVVGNSNYSSRVVITIGDLPHTASGKIPYSIQNNPLAGGGFYPSIDLTLSVDGQKVAQQNGVSPSIGGNNYSFDYTDLSVGDHQIRLHAQVVGTSTTWDTTASMTISKPVSIPSPTLDNITVSGTARSNGSLTGTVTNGNASDATVTVVLLVDGSRVDSADIQVSANQSSTADFKIPQSASDGQQHRFCVKATAIQ